MEEMPGTPGGRPLREIVSSEAGEHGGEPADLLGCGLQLGAPVEDGLELVRHAPDFFAWRRDGSAVVIDVRAPQ